MNIRKSTKQHNYYNNIKLLAFGTIDLDEAIKKFPRFLDNQDNNSMIVGIKNDLKLMLYKTRELISSNENKKKDRSSIIAIDIKAQSTYINITNDISSLNSIAFNTKNKLEFIIKPFELKTCNRY